MFKFLFFFIKCFSLLLLGCFLFINKVFCFFCGYFSIFVLQLVLIKLSFEVQKNNLSRFYPGSIWDGSIRFSQICGWFCGNNKLR